MPMSVWRIDDAIVLWYRLGYQDPRQNEDVLGCSASPTPAEFFADASHSAGSCNPNTPAAPFRSAVRSTHSPSVPARACAALSGQMTLALRLLLSKRSNHGRESETDSRGRSKCLAKLLQSPLRVRMRGHVVVQDSAAPDLHHDKNVKHSKSGRHRHQEITCRDGFAWLRTNVFQC